MSGLPAPRPLASLLTEDHYTEEVKTVLRMSATEATRLGHRYIAGEHVLIAAIASDTPSGALLRDTHAEAAQARSRVEFIVPHEPAFLMGGGGAGEIRVGPRLLALLEDEAEIAASLETAVALPHLLLALLRDREGLPTRVLDECGVDTRALTARLRVLP